MEYDQARGPIAAEMARIIEPLEEQARSRTGGRNFDKIVAWAEAAAQKADRDDMAARCNDLKKAVAKPNAFEKSAVQQESEDAMRLACSGLDTYSR